MGFLSDVFGGGGGGSSDVEWATPPESEEVKEARKRLFELGTRELPDIPLRGIARAKPIPFKEGEQEDFWSMPEVQGIIMEAVQKGDLLANRIGRGLQATGNMASTPGRDVLGRAVTDVQKNLTASLAPFAEAQRGRAFTERTQERNWRLQQELLAMGYSQDELNALFQQETTETMLPYTLQAPIFESIISNQPAVQPIIPSQQPSMLTQLAPLLGPLMSSVLQSGGGGGGGGGITGGGTSGDIQMAAMLASMFSDAILKTDTKTIENALDIIEQLDGKTFKFIEGTKSGGVIAQEIEKVLPDAVSEKDGYKTVDYTAIIGLLINAVKELHKKIQEN